MNDRTLAREGENADAHKAWLRALELTAPIGRTSTTLPHVIESLARKLGDTPALLSEGEIVSYRVLGQRINRYARWALDEGLGDGDAVCLLMANCPDYVAIWLGLIRVGCVVALVNAN